MALSDNEKVTVLIAELESLLHAELSYAYFNAKRTTDEPGGGMIERSRICGIPCISDSRREDSTYYNRAVVPPDFTSLAEVAQHLPQSIRAVELPTFRQTDPVFSALACAGFVPDSSLCYLTANSDTTTSPECKVMKLRSDQRDDFLDLLELSGVSFSRQKRHVSRRFYCTEAFHCFVAYDRDDAPAGWATMYVDAGAAFLANAFTLPKYRNRGFHSALLAARLDLASALKMKQVFTDVEPASQSHRNCLRNGFRLLSVNNIWVRMREE